MALAIADRVKETTTSTGTGTINLAGASTGFQTFVAGIGGGNTCYYAIEDADGSAWEVGIGTVTDASPDTLARTTVLKSTNSNNALTLTSGTHTVFATYPSDKAVFKDESGIVLASGIQVGASGLLLDSVTITTLQAASESFADNDTSLMTSASIQDKIEDYGYTTNTGDITAVVAGSGISGGATSSSATVTLDLNGLASGVIADNDYLLFVDVNDSNSGKKESLGDIAALFAGTNLTAANSVISVDDAFLKNDASDTTTGGITAGGFTTSGTWTMDTSAGGTTAIDSINITNAFTDSDTVIMSAGAIKEKIEGYSYTTNTGDITAVVAGSGISGGATSGSATVTLDLNGLASGVVADNDYLVFVDVNDSNSGKKENLGDIAALFAGTNLTAANSVIAVDDAFLKNDANDTTTGTVTAAGFTTTGLATASGVKVQRDSASGVIINSQIAFGDYTFMLPSGNGTDGQVLTTDSKNTYWSTSSGGVSGDTFATDLKIGRDAHNLIDFTTDDAVTFRVGNADEITLAANEFSPTTSDGIALGTGSKMWSDLFLANGGVVNFNNGDATLTHESNKIVASGCELVVNRPGRSLATFRRTDDGDASIEVDASFHDADNDAQLRMLTGTSGKASIFFGDTADNNIGLISYDHSDNSLTIKTNATEAVSIDSDGTLATKGIIREVATKVDTNYTIAADDHIILVDTTNSDRTITLPSAAAANIGQEYTVKKIDSGTGVVNIVPNTTGGYGPDDIDEYDLKYVLYVQHDSVTFVCGPGDATAGDEQWWITAERKQAHAGIMQQRTVLASSDQGQTISNATLTEVTWDTIEKEIPAGLADLSTERFDIARSGLYNVCGHLWYDNGIATGDRCDLLIYKNGTIVKQVKTMVAHSSSMYVTVQLNTVMNLAPNDYIELWTYQDTGSIPLHVHPYRYATFAISEIL